MDDLVDKTDHLSVSSKAFYKEVRRERAWRRRREAEGRGVRGGGGGGGQEEGERRGGKEQGEEEGGGGGVEGKRAVGEEREFVCMPEVQSSSQSHLYLFVLQSKGSCCSIL